MGSGNISNTGKEAQVDEQTLAEAPPRPTLEELHALMQAKQAEYDQLREQHAALWGQRKAATLSREGYIDFLWTEDRMALLLREIEQLTPAVLYAEAEDAITTGKAHYDAHSEAVTAAATQICEAWAAFIQACAQFVALADEQIRLLWSMPDASGQPFADLPDGQVLLQRMIQMFPHQPGTLMESIVRTLRVPMTVGDYHNALEMVPGRQPFPETLVRRFLAGYEYTTEGTPHE
jgi:hypothetical protein